MSGNEEESRKYITESCKEETSNTQGKMSMREGKKHRMVLNNSCSQN